MSGLDFLESAQNAPKVIITSAYERYALRGYEFDVVDYLLKPISFSRFLKSVNKAHALMESTSKSEEPAYIFVKTEKQLKRLYLKEIQFIEGMENYIVIHTLTSKEIVHLRLKSIQETLPAQIFMQVHRSFIVNLSYVQAIESLGSIKSRCRVLYGKRYINRSSIINSFKDKYPKTNTLFIIEHFKYSYLSDYQ